MPYVKQGSIDHLVYAVPELNAGIDQIERLLGVRAAHGGKHLGRGTHNALLALGGNTYLEIIAPDADQPDPPTPRPFGLDRRREPGLVTFAVSVPDIEHRAEQARAEGYDPGVVLTMSRHLPNGDELRWELSANLELPGDGVVPFLIHWEPGSHPSEAAPAGARLLDLEAEHPQPEVVGVMLEALGVELTVTGSARPALIATIDGPNGTVVLT